MLDMHGKYSSCRVFAETVEDTAIRQIQTFLDHPAFEGSKIRIMPDVHAGAGAVIGFTATMTDKVIPNVVGVDIGCGVIACPLAQRITDFPAFDRKVRELVPSGFSVRNDIHPDYGDDLMRDVHVVCEETEQDVGRVDRSVGTLGGGNHFIEIGEDDQQRHWLVVHTGSRNFGLKIANWHQRKAIDLRGKQGGLEWLEGDDARSYIRHMQVAQMYAIENRLCIVDSLLPATGDRYEIGVESVHNYIDFDIGIIRKGAISARAGEHVVVPWNMRDGTIIGIGKGNDDWNCSAPHGAGRAMGRGDAKRRLRMDDFKAAMEGIWSSCVTQGTIDESPMAYKNHAAVEDAMKDTVTIRTKLRPVYNFKAGAENE